MPYSNSSRVSDSPLSFLEQNPSLSDFLFADCNLGLQEAATFIEPVLHAKKRCQTSSFYIQAVTNGCVSFLATNINDVREIEVTKAASHWLMGRSSICALSIANPQLSRRHAVVGYSTEGFYITDVGSSNGTWVNRLRLVPMERQALQDGDVIRLGSVRVEFFALHLDREGYRGADATCF